MKAKYDYRPPFKDGQSWGRWTFDAHALVLRDERGYEIDLERCDSSAATLDYIMQVVSKPMVYTNEDVGDLVRAIENIIDPQMTLCGSGMNRRIHDIKKYLTTHIEP